MFFRSLASLFLLPAALRSTWAQNSSSSSSACNNSPSLCNLRYDQVTYLGAHDSPFLRNEGTFFSASGNQFYSTSVQLSAGVRLLTAQVQVKGGQLHVCHTSCDLLDAGSLSSWLGEVRSWMESNPNDVVTVLLVNGAQASVSDLAAQYSAAGITTSLAYTPSSSNARNQTWPTLQSLITSGTRLLNFVDYGVDDNSAAPYIMPEYSYIFENPYDITSSSAFSCEANRPTKFVDNTGQALSNGLMPLMNHFLDNEAGFGIEQPAVSNTPTTNAPSGGIGTLGYSATQCTQEYGRPPTYVLVDYFNVGPAIATVDRLNGVTNPVGRTKVSEKILTSSASFEIHTSRALWSACLTILLAFTML